MEAAEFPQKIISLIRCTYQEMSCRIAHAGQLSDSFEFKTEVRAATVAVPPPPAYGVPSSIRRMPQSSPAPSSPAPHPPSHAPAPHLFPFF